MDMHHRQHHDQLKNLFLNFLFLLSYVFQVNRPLLPKLTFDAVFDWYFHMWNQGKKVIV